MARIYDQVLAEGLKPPVGWLKTPEEVELWKPHARELRQALERCEVIVADNVAEYFYAGNDQEVWDTTKDFPCVAPPFESFWIEHRTPSRIVSRETGVSTPDPNNLGVGIWFQVQSFESRLRTHREATPDERAVIRRDDLHQAERLMGQLTPDRQRYLQEGLRQSLAGGEQDAFIKTLTAGEQFLCSVLVRESWEKKTGRQWIDEPLPEMPIAWFMTAWSVISLRRQGLIGPCLRWDFQLDSQGEILSKPQVAIIGRRPAEGALELNPMVFPALLTLSFLNCKNVRRVWTEPDAPLSRKYEKKTGKPLCRFWTLGIEPVREVLKREGQSESTGLKKALHICRGHFAVYEERPLFGKYTGRFWRPSHARGAINEGVVDKVYAMKKFKKP